jgi:hypothetical protein
MKKYTQKQKYAGVYAKNTAERVALCCVAFIL